MKKKAFTLNEVLITLGIIGVIAALTFPAINKMRPNETKMKYMKVYNALTTITNDILDDPSLYYITYTNGVPNCKGLYCAAIPLIAPYNTINYAGIEKYPMLIASRLNLQVAPVANTAQDGKSSVLTFTTTDNVHWSFSTQNDLINNTYSIILTINVNPADTSTDHNCVYGDTGCTLPNQFRFAIDNDANIKADDALGQAFLQNPTDMKNKDKDLENAEKIMKSQSPAQQTSN